MKKKQIHCISLGCARNLVDSEIMLGVLQKEGFSITPIVQNADFIIVNTCGFLSSSREESLETISSAIQMKKKHAKVIVTGCLAQMKGNYLDPLKEQIHYIVGSGELVNIVKAISSKDPGEIISENGSFLENPCTPRLLSTPPHYAYVKIAEGCQKRCSYCIIPLIKGPLQSKKIDQVSEEVSSLIEKGVFEIILIAQDLGDYGKDLGFKGSSGLVHLLQKILSLKKDFRLRLLYLYPDEISDELISLMKNDSRILPYIDMPIQHISDTILHTMRRTTNSAHIRSVVEKLHKEIPKITLRTSLIVGFPGETEEDFQQLVNLVSEKMFDTIGFFAYSNEPLSASKDLPHQISEEEKQKRVSLLGSLQRQHIEKSNKQKIGTKIPVLIDGYHPETNMLLVGRTVEHCPEVDASILINEFDTVRSFGEIYLVEITDVSEYDLIGKVIKPLKKSEWQ